MAKITIFGLAGTGKTSTAKLVAEMLGLEFNSTGNMFREEANKLGMTLNEFEELCKTDKKYDIELDRKTAEYGKTHDNFIFESRLAWYFIPDSFKIMLDCDFEERTNRIALREGKDLEKVRNETQERENAITERYENYYGIKNFSDASNFDFVVNTQIHSLQEVVDVIIKELKERKIVF